MLIELFHFVSQIHTSAKINSLTHAEVAGIFHLKNRFAPFVFHKISIVLLCLLDLFLVVLIEPARLVHYH